MQPKIYSNAIIISSILAMTALSIFATSVATSFAFLGFDMLTGSDQNIKNSQNTLQGSHCYSPNASIIDSCNSGDISETENLGQNYLAQ
jgi:hypothetical protein